MFLGNTQWEQIQKGQSEQERKDNCNAIQPFINSVLYILHLSIFMSLFI